MWTILKGDPSELKSKESLDSTPLRGLNSLVAILDFITDVFIF